MLVPAGRPEVGSACGWPWAAVPAVAALRRRPGAAVRPGSRLGRLAETAVGGRAQGSVTLSDCALPDWANSARLRSTAMVSRAFSTGSRSTSTTSSCGSAARRGQHLAGGGRDQAAADTGRPDGGDLVARVGLADGGHDAGGVDARGPGRAASTARACLGPTPTTRAR